MSLNSFNKFTRYFAVPESHWYSGQIQSDISQFMSVQFVEHKEIINIVNQLSDPSNVIKYAGGAESLVTVNSATTQSISWSLQGNGTQFVWINADSA